MRTRSTSIPSPNGVNRVFYTEDYTQYNGDTTILMPPAKERWMHDVVTPRFKDRVQRGELIINPMSSGLVIRTFSGSWGIQRYKPDGSRMIGTHSWDQGIYTWASGFITYPQPFVDYKSACVGDAGNAAIGNMDGGEMQLPVFLAELGRTRRLFLDTMTVIERAIRGRLTARRGANPIPTRDEMANAWTAVRFGMMPLLFDLENAVRFLSKARLVRHTARGASSQTWEGASDWAMADGVGNYWGGRTVSNVEWSARAGLIYETSNSINAELARLGFFKPLSVAWELVTLSFVVDRFISIGRWLDACQPSATAVQKAAWLSIKTIRHDHLFSTGVNSYGASYGVTFQNGHFAFDCQFFREEKSRDPWANPSASLPTWNPHFNLLHLADYAALIWQRIPRGIRRKL